MKITDKVIRKVLHHEISREKMWWYWTTSEGLKSFFCESSKIELTPLGAYEIYFSMDWPEGERGSEGCKVLSYLPSKMLSFTWNAPPKYDEVRNHTYKTWVVIEFDEKSLTLTHLGWPEGDQWDAVYDYFNQAWSYVFEKLNRACKENSYLYIWKFEVCPEKEEAFKKIYGSDGDWVKLFKKGNGHIQTRLIKDLDKPYVYTTIDVWESEEAFIAFKAKFAEEFDALDKRCESLTENEVLIGRFSS